MGPRGLGPSGPILNYTGSNTVMRSDSSSMGAILSITFCRASELLQASQA
jgi:hypothetical protein